jgi:hypothetical protein
MKLKAGMWFKNSDGDDRVLMSTVPDIDGDLFHMAMLSQQWSFSKPEGIQNWWTPLKRAPWFAFETRKIGVNYGPHTFRAVYSPDGKKALIMAGCKAWPSLTAARRHFKERSRSFLSAKHNDAYNASALRYLDRLEEAMRSRRAVKVLRRMVAQRRAA